MTEEEKKSIEIVKNIPYRHKDIFMSEDLAIAKILNLIQKLQEENKKKDNIIDLMAFLIANKIGTRTVICENMNCDKADIEDCKMCAIQYFKNKAIQEEK